MKRKFAALSLALVLILCLFSGCASVTNSDYVEINTDAARSGVARVVAYYDKVVRYTDGTLAGYLQKHILLYTGSAFGVGTTGEPTDIFVTNRHVIAATEYEGEAILTPSGNVTSDTSAAGDAVVVQWEFSQAYILEDDYAINSETEEVDTSRATPCKVLYRAEDNEADIAILQTADILEDRMALPLLDTSYKLDAGDTVYALGYPGTSDAASSDTTEAYAGSVDRVTVTDGVMSVYIAIDENGTEIDTIQHTATINSGNSGGPLITETGEVAGINTMKFRTGSSSDTWTNNAIETKYIIKALDEVGASYDLRTPDDVPNNLALYIGIGVAAVVVIAAIVIVAVVVSKKKKKQPVPAGTSPQPIAPTRPAEHSAPVILDDTGLRIQAVSGTFVGKRFAVGNQMRIGRDPARNDLVFPDNTQGVSGVHCLLVYQNNQLYLQDLGSTYGTFLGGGQKLAANQSVALHIGDKFSLGSQQECFVVTGKGGI